MQCNRGSPACAWFGELHVLKILGCRFGFSARSPGLRRMDLGEGCSNMPFARFGYITVINFFFGI